MVILQSQVSKSVVGLRQKARRCGDALQVDKIFVGVDCLNKKICGVIGNVTDRRCYVSIGRLF